MRQKIKKMLISDWPWLIGALLVLALIYYPVAMKYSQSFKFVDEEEYIVNGWLMTKGDQLYRDISTNHQPLTYFMSQGLQSVLEMPNDYMLIRRHRQAVFAWAVIWWVILLFRFRRRVILPLFIFESLKFFSIGNQFVAEALAAYPAGYLFLSIYELVVEKKKRKEDFFLGCISAALPLLVLPLGLYGLVLAGIRYVYLKGRGWWQFGLGGLMILVLVGMKVNALDYYRETILNNTVYAIPRLSPIQHPVDYFKMGLLPFLFTLNYQALLGQWVGLVTLVWALGMAVWLRRGQYRRAGWGFIFYLVWQLTNLRVITAAASYYEALHLTPWLMTGLLMMGYVLADLMQTKKWWPKAAVGFGAAVVIGGLFLNKNMPFNTKIDPQTEHYVQFTPLVQAAAVINTLKQPQDKLMVLPNEVLIHWLTGLEPATRQVTYYEWQFYPPEIQTQYQQVIRETPPTFIVYTDEGSAYGPSIKKLLAEEYWQIFHLPDVYIYKDAIGRLTADQRQEFSELPFEGHQIVQLPK